MDSKLLSHLIKIANDAGEAIMAIHKKPSNFEIKSDNISEEDSISQKSLDSEKTNEETDEFGFHGKKAGLIAF